MEHTSERSDFFCKEIVKFWFSHDHFISRGSSLVILFLHGTFFLFTLVSSSLSLNGDILQTSSRLPRPSHIRVGTFLKPFFSLAVSLQIDAHEDDVNAVAFADSSSQLLFSGSDDALCKVWDRRTLREDRPQPVGHLAGHRDGITFIHSKVRRRERSRKLSLC